MSQEELGRKIGVQKSAIHKYENNIVVNLKSDTIKKLAYALDVKPSFLMGFTDENDMSDIEGALPIQRNAVPMLGLVSCGEPKYAEEDFQYYVSVGAELHADFALRASGDSMIGARIYDGDIVFVRRQPDVDDGQIAVVLIDDEALLKRVYKLPDGRIQLRAENPRYQPIMVGGAKETRTIRILGRAIAVQTDVI
jgi:repressor LexA